MSADITINGARDPGVRLGDLEAGDFFHFAAGRAYVVLAVERTRTPEIQTVLYMSLHSGDVFSSSLNLDSAVVKLSLVSAVLDTTEASR